jgi:hypothetical protein
LLLKCYGTTQRDILRETNLFSEDSFWVHNKRHHMVNVCFLFTFFLRVLFMHGSRL